jgi:hypothetical protein
MRVFGQLASNDRTSRKTAEYVASSAGRHRRHATNGATAFLIIMTMTFGLILPRLLFERLLPTPS